MGTFITNDKEKNLKDRIRKLIERSSELKFLVGFFYFSGAMELYESLKRLHSEGKLNDGHLRILVGLSIDEDNYGIYESARILEKKNKDLIKDDFFRSIQKAFTSKDLDKKEVYEQVDFFVKLLSEGKIVLRKTKDPNHAKLYLFKMNDDVKDVLTDLFITGSSNLTRAGFELQNEFNVEIKDFGFEEAERYFDDLWRTSVDLSIDDVNRIKEIIKNDTFFRSITPFDAYVYLLKLYLEMHSNETLFDQIVDLMERKGYKPYSYQVDAIAQAISKCREHGGVILADVVGLGKSVIASVVAKLLNKRGVVLCPPHLVGDENKTSGWKKYVEDFELWGWDVRSIGKLDEVLKYVRERKNIEVIIVDEAHRFRNEKTKQYEYLREICRGKTVILLTATPFNNRPSDIFALLKLFSIPKNSSIVFDGRLEQRFYSYEMKFEKISYIKKYYKSVDPEKRKKAREYYKGLFGEDKVVDIKKVDHEAKKLAEEIKSTIALVVIRRNRLDLKNYEDKVDLPEVKDPQELFFELTPEQSEFYDKVIKTFQPLDEGGRFKGAIYLPTKYEKGVGYYEGIGEESDEFDDEDYVSGKLSKEEKFLYARQINIYKFMRRLLVKRFESSFNAFYESVKRFKRFHEVALEFINKTNKFILNRDLMEDLLEKGEDSEIFEILESYERDLENGNIKRDSYKVFDLDSFANRDGFIEDIRGDMELFEEILTEMDELKLKSDDPKAKALIRKVGEFLDNGRKVVIFTEYIDTANYLSEVLEANFKGKVLTAVGDFSKEVLEGIYKNFDAQYKYQEDRYQILLATDKISEGFNLNRAGVVINYDIPWNPVRVIQRVGRINRIGKKVYDEIYIVNFFPTEKGADFVRSREIAAMKMFMIHNVLGEDAKIFSPDEEPQPSELYSRINRYSEDGDEDFYSKVRKEFNELKEKYGDVVRRLERLPNRIKVAKRGNENELMVFVRRDKELFVGYKRYDGSLPVYSNFEEVYDKIKASPNEPLLELSNNFWENYLILLEKRNYERSGKVSLNKVAQKAVNLLESLLKVDDENIRTISKFIKDLIEDIIDYGTLSNYTLSRIVEMDNYYQKRDFRSIHDELVKLKNELGEDFLDLIKRKFRERKEEVIIAIENLVL